MSVDIGDRVSLIEKALTRLTIIQEQQTKQTEKIINSMDNFAKISLTVEQNAKDIDELHISVTKLRDKAQDTIAKAGEIKEYCSELSFRRFKLAISTSTAIVVALFGYLYLDVTHAVKSCHYLEKEVIKLEMQHKGIFNGKIKR